jgi:hypothetical protein
MKDIGFLERIQSNTMRYISLFSQVIDANMPQPQRNFKDDDYTTQDVLMA